MAYEKKEGDIAVFFQKNKTNDRAPDWKGEVLIDGELKTVALWIKNDGMLAGKVESKRDFTKKEETPYYDKNQYAPAPNDDGFESDFPF